MSSKYKDLNSKKEYSEIPEGKVLPIVVNGLPVTEEAHDKYKSNHPTDLDEVVVVSENPTELLKYMHSWNSVFGSGNPIWGKLRVENFVKAEEKSPNFMDNWYLAQNVGDAINYGTGGLTNRLSLSLNIGLAVDAFQGDDIRQSWFGNSGIVSDKFALEHPVISTVANMAFDGVVPMGVAKTIGWGNTYKSYPGGAEMIEIRTAPFKSKVIKIGTVTPEEMVVKNAIPETIPSYYKGTTPEGLYMYELLKMYIPRKFGKRISKLYLKLADHNYFPETYDKATLMLDFINPVTLEALTDLAIGNIGKPSRFSLNYKIIDPSVLPISDYMAIQYKNGGKFRNEKD